MTAERRWAIENRPADCKSDVQWSLRLGKSKAYVAKMRHDENKKIAKAEVSVRLAPIKPFDLDDFIGWAQMLIVPLPGEFMGQPFKLQEFQIDFLRRTIGNPECRIGILSIPRKSGKTMLIALLMLYLLIEQGDYWLGVVASVTGLLTKTLQLQMKALASVNNLGDPDFRASPAPGTVLFGTKRIQCVAKNEKTTGHSLQPSIVLFDELGKATENDRTVVNSLRSGLATTQGVFLGISPQFDSEIMREYRKMAESDDSIVYVHYGANETDDPFEPATWIKANPALGNIKPMAYMEAEARQAEASPKNLNDFLTQELNMRASATKTNVVAVHEWLACEVEDLPPRDGPVFIGLDIGGSRSFCGAAAYWPTTARMEFYGGCPAVPNLRDRGRADGVGEDYEVMYRRGELRVYGEGKSPNVVDFVRDVMADILPAIVGGMAADRYKMADVEDALDLAGWPYEVDWRAVGKGPHGTADIEAFIHLVDKGQIKAKRNHFMHMAIRESTLIINTNGNKTLDKRKYNGRIDCLQASVLAAGLGRRWKNGGGDLWVQTSWLD